MTFHFTKIAAAAALAAVATSSMADPIGTPNRPLTNYTSGTTDIYLAGSSAVDLALTKFIANACKANSLDVYRTDAAGKTYYLWTCETDSTVANPFVTSNTKLAIHKNTNSSADGVNFVADGAAAVPFLQVSDLTGTNCSTTSLVNVPATATIPSYNVAACGTTAGAAGVGTASAVATFGFSDSEPNQYNSSKSAQLTSAYPFTIIQGIPVSLALRNALQAKQGLAVGGEAEADMPSIAAQQVTEIYAGRYSTWATALGVTLAGDNSVYKIRRSGGSGTTRAFDATFMGTFCNLSAPTAFQASPVTLTVPATQCVAGTKYLQAGTSDDVVSCLSQYNAGGLGAIGYLSTDYQPGVADGYRWIKVDGYAPKVLNVADGKWKMWSELSFNYNKATGVTGDNLAFYNVIKGASASTTLLSEVVNNLTQVTSGGWKGGIIGALSGGKNAAGFGVPATSVLNVPRTDASVAASPAMPFTRGISAGYNMCAVPFSASGYSAQ